jgi:hypothetical protein
MNKAVKLTVGMKVICVYKGISYIENKTGRIIKAESDGTIGVRFDHTNVNFHDCNGRCEKNRGYWLDRTQLKPLGAFIDGWEQTQIKRKKK